MQFAVDGAITKVRLSGEPKAAQQADVNTTARFHAGDRLVLETEHGLNPRVASAELTWRF